MGRELGAGALGRVVELVDDDGGRWAGKLLHDSHDADGRARRRFEVEARLLAGIEHPNLIGVRGLVHVDGRAALLMELVPGADLAHVIASEAPLPAERVIELGRGIAAGLAVAHRAGLVHRDLKPANILLGADGTPKVGDFGLARAASFASSDPDAVAVAGTPDYMAPESVDPLAIDARSDLYALGCILYELATGAPPYRGATAFAVLQAHRTAPLPALDAVPDGLRRVIRWLLAKSPADRPQSATEVEAALAGIGTSALATLGETRVAARPARGRAVAGRPALRRRGGARELARARQLGRAHPPGHSVPRRDARAGGDGPGARRRAGRPRRAARARRRARGDVGMTGPPTAIPGQQVLDEPRRLRHELAWPIALPDGRRAVLAQLVPELAADVALRRRWVVDMERIAALPVARLAPTIAIGPEPDPRAPGAAPPWRVRLDPPGQPLDTRLRRAPLPDDEAIALGCELADALQSLHAAGAVLRDLDPRAIVLGDDGRAWFTDIGHARLAILSSRTASSLLLESSPYMAPEALLGTVVDARADVYSLGVVLWRALTGDVPFEASLLASRTVVPDLAALRPKAPRALVALITRCLAHDPERRPPTARDVGDALRGNAADRALALVRTTCQACGAAMTAGLRLCLSCGKQAVQFHRTAPGDPDGVAIELRRASEDAAFLARLSAFYTQVAAHVPRLNFVVGDRRMYSKAELGQRHAVPAVLVADLQPDTATALAARLRDDGFKIRTTTPRRERRRRRRAILLAVAGLAGILTSIGGLVAGSSGAFPLLLVVSMFAGLFGLLHQRGIARAARRLPIGELRASPAMLPAADAQVAAVAAALASARSPDVRARLEELAILVQRMCDADQTLAGNATSRAPVAGLVELAATTAAAIEAIDQQLATLDEGAIVRALGRSEARREAPALRVDLLAGLDTLRQLEDQRARLLGRLLEITSLARTAVEIDLAQAAAAQCEDIEVARAFEALRAAPRR